MAKDIQHISVRAESMLDCPMPHLLFCLVALATRPLCFTPLRSEADSHTLDITEIIGDLNLLYKEESGALSPVHERGNFQGSLTMPRAGLYLQSQTTSFPASTWITGPEEPSSNLQMENGASSTSRRHKIRAERPRLIHI